MKLDLEGYGRKHGWTWEKGISMSIINGIRFDDGYRTIGYMSDSTGTDFYMDGKLVSCSTIQEAFVVPRSPAARSAT